MRMRSLLVAVSSLTAAACTTGGPAAGAAPQIEVEATLSGAASGHVALAHAIDAADACRLAGAAAAHAATASGVVETPDGPPAYRFQLADRGYAFALSAAPYAGAPTFNDASNAGLWVTTPDGTWTLPPSPKPGSGSRSASPPTAGRGRSGPPV